MDFIKLFEEETGIDKEHYNFTLNKNGDVETIAFYDVEGWPFQYNGDLIQALSPFLWLRQIHFEVSEFTITDLSGLAVFEHLEWLNLSDCCQEADISVLSGLKNLKHVALDNARINDINSLKDLKNLESLSLSGNNIKTIEILKEHSNLTLVNFSYNQLTDISSLSKCKGLKTLSADFNQINDLSFVKELTELEHLRLENNSLKDISFVSHLLKLKTLWVPSNPIENIVFISSLSDLLQLNIQKIPIDNLTALADLTKLTYLRAGPIKNFEDEILSHFEELIVLTLNDCNINDLIFLKPLKKLFNLNLDNNSISDFSVLFELPQLKYLSLRNNLISEPYPPHAFENLVSLDLTGNLFGNKAYNHSYGQFNELNVDTANYWYNIGDHDRALAYFYVNSIGKVSLIIYHKKLVNLKSSDDYLRLYYVMRCENILIHLKDEDEEIQKIRKDTIQIVKDSQFFNRTELSISLADRGKNVMNYIYYSEYTAYLNSNEEAKINPEILYMLGSKTLNKRENLDKLLSLYQQLLRMDSLLYLALHQTITRILKMNFAYIAPELTAFNYYKDLLTHINEREVQFFDSTRWFKEHYSNYIHDKRVTKKENVTFQEVERTYPEVSAWKILARITFIIIALISILKGCR